MKFLVVVTPPYIYHCASICLLSSIDYSSEIIWTLGIITLVSDTVAGTLGGDTALGTLGVAIIGTSLGNNFVWVFPGCMVLNHVANLSMACNWLSPILKGCLGPVFFSTCIRSLAALVACSVVDNPGMTRCCGKNSIISACISLLVVGV